MKNSYEKDLEKVFDTLEEKRLLKAADLMEKLIVRLFKRDVVMFDSVKQVSHLVTAIKKQERDKASYLQHRKLYGNEYEEILARDIGTYFASILLEDRRVKEKIGNVDMATLCHYLSNRMYDEVDYNYQAAVIRMHNAAVQSGRIAYMKKDAGTENRYSLCLVYEYQIQDATECLCFIDHGMTGDLWSYDGSVYANYCDFTAYLKYQPLLGRKEVVRDREILTVTEDGTIFAFDSDGKLRVKKKYERERMIPELTRESDFEVVNGENLLLRRRYLKEGISETPVLLRLVWDHGEMEVKEYLLSKKNQANYVWDRLVKRITAAGSEDNLLAVLGSDATPLSVPEPFTVEAVKETLDRLGTFYPQGTNAELDTVCAFVKTLSENILLSSEFFLCAYLYTYVEFVEAMFDISAWERERVYKRAMDPGNGGYIDYQMKLSFLLNRCPKKPHWTVPEGYVGFFDFKNGELRKDFVGFSNADEVEITMDGLKKRTNREKYPGELRFDRFENSFIVKWDSKDKFIEGVLRKALGTRLKIEFETKENTQEMQKWEMLHDLEFFEAMKRGKL